jgi:Uncharacterized conserved protein, contains FHA domain
MLLRFQSPEEFKQALISENSTQLAKVPTTVDSNKITIGRDCSCDLFVNDPQERVSRRHMEISWEDVSGGVLYVFLDRSTNGSMINERFIHGESCSLLEKRLGKGANSISPTIILAGTVLLDWNDVKNVIDNKKKTFTATTPISAIEEEVPLEPMITRSDSLSGGEFLLCIVLPFLGFIWFNRNKDVFPNKARVSKLAGWVGVFIYILLAIIIVLSTR